LCTRDIFLFDLFSYYEIWLQRALESLSLTHWFRFRIKLVKVYWNCMLSCVVRGYTERAVLDEIACMLGFSVSKENRSEKTGWKRIKNNKVKTREKREQLQMRTKTDKTRCNWRFKYTNKIGKKKTETIRSKWTNL